MESKYVRVVGIYCEDIDPQIDLILKNSINDFISEGLSFSADAEPLTNKDFNSLINLQFVVKFSLNGKEIASNDLTVKFHTSKEYIISDDTILDEIIKEAYLEFFEETTQSILPIIKYHKLQSLSEEVIATVKDQLLEFFSPIKE